MISAYAMDEIKMDDWAGKTVKCLLLKMDSVISPVPSDEFLSDLNLAENEVDVADTPDYVRVDVEGLWAEFDLDDQKFRFHCNSPNFGILEGGGYGGYVFYEVPDPDDEDDATSKIIRAIDGLNAPDGHTFPEGVDMILTVNEAGLWTKANG